MCYIVAVIRSWGNASRSMGFQTLSVTTQCEGIWYSFLEVIVTTAAESPTRVLRGSW